MTKVVTHVVCAALLGACTSQRPAQVPEPASPWRGDTLLAAILDVPNITTPQLVQADSLGNRIGEVLHERLMAVVADTMAPPRIRANALTLLAERREPDIQPYEDALASSDERLRTAAIGALRHLMYLSPLAMANVKKGLQDPSPMVQIKTLEVLGDADEKLLREYVTRTTDPTRRQIAQELIVTAEERGAPLLPQDSTGRFERVTASGYTITFQPTKWWPNWSAGAGELLITPKGKPPINIAGRIEVVNRVIPAFIDPEGRFLVYESNRTIYVRNLETGQNRTIGPGIAPRLIPLSSSFVYLRQKAVTENAGGASIKYDVVQLALAPGGTEVITGELDANTSLQRFGNYSPARWMRVRDRAGGFFLMGDGVSLVKLEVMT